MACILVIDDQVGVRDVLKELLEHAGHEVFLASDGRQGLKTCESTSIDVVITDLHMPGMNGLETVRAIKERFPSTRIVTMSGADTYMVETNLESSIINGADHALLKPFSAPQVLNAIDALLAQTTDPRTGAFSLA